MNQQQNQWNTQSNMNGSNMSLNMPPQGYYPGEQPVWLNSWGHPVMIPYQGMPQNGNYIGFDNT